MIKGRGPTLKKKKKRTHLPMQEMQETHVWTLGQKDPMEEELATHSGFLPEKSHGQRSLAPPWGSSRGHKQSDTTEQLSTQKNKPMGLSYECVKMNKAALKDSLI